MTKNADIALKNTASRHSWIVCLCAALFFFYEFIQMHLCSTISGELMRDLSLNAVGFSTLSTLFFIANTVFLLPAGLILDRYPIRKVILTAFAICLIGAILFAISTQPLMLFLGRFLTGVGNAFCFLSCMLLITQWFPTQQRSFVTAIVVTIAMFGGIVAQTPLRFLVDSVGWRHALLYDAGLGVIFFLLVLRYVHENKTNTLSPPVNETDFIRTLYASIRNWPNLCYGLYAALLNLPTIILGAVWGSLYLHQVHSVSMTEASLGTSMIFLGTIVGSPAAGAWADRIGQYHLPMLIGGFGSLFCTLCLLSITPLSLTQIMLLFFTLGMFTSTQILAYPKIAEINPAHTRGTALGAASTLIMGIAAAAVPFFGYLMQQHAPTHHINSVPIYSPDSYQCALYILPIGFSIALIALRLVIANPPQQEQV